MSNPAEVVSDTKKILKEADVGLEELVRNPTQELLDEYLLRINEANNIHIEVQAQEKVYEKRFKEKSDVVQKEHKKLPRNRAEGIVRDTMSKACNKGLDIELNRRALDKKVPMMKTNYYHAKAKIEDNRMIETKAAEAGGRDPFAI